MDDAVTMQTKRGPRKRPSGFNIATRADRDQLTNREIARQRNRLLVQGWGLLSEVDEGRLNAAHRILAEHLWAAIETLKLAKKEIERLRITANRLTTYDSAVDSPEPARRHQDSVS